MLRILNAPLSAPSLVVEKGVGPVELDVNISLAEVETMCEKSRRLFMASDALLYIDRSNTLIVVADLHGQAVHLLRIFRTCGFPPAQRYLFLGDYVDRGAQGVIVIMLLLCMRLRYPKHVFLLRGNHEDVNTTLNYGFYDECLLRWNKGDGGEEAASLGEKAWHSFIGAFNCMPIGAVVGQSIFCSHGGISPFIRNLDDINKVACQCSKFEGCAHATMTQVQTVRPAIVPPYGIACDLLWSDPSPPGQVGWSLSHRGISFTYGTKAVEDFCKAHSLAFVIRGHQIFNEMYRYGYVLRCNGRLLSLFSALNYENYKNNACVAKIVFKDGGNIRIEMIIYRCRHYAPPKKKDSIVHREKQAAAQLQKQEKSLTSSQAVRRAGRKKNSGGSSSKMVRKPRK